MVAIGLGMRWNGQATDKQERHSILALIVGYLVFLIPTAIAYSINPATRRGIPSIMCGFAVLFALILALYLLPRANKLAKR
jgi:protein-S-isoprenylcysteine O-methyltransferase Ste14